MKKNHILLLICITLAGFACKPDEPEPEPDLSALDFQRFLGHSEEAVGNGRNLMALLPDDHVVFAYTTFTQDEFGNKKEQNIYLTKYDITGKQIWNKLITNKFVNFCTAFHATSDGGFLVGAAKAIDDVFYYNSLIYLVKADAEGTVLWEKTFENEQQGRTLSVTEGKDGNYYLLGIKEKTQENFVFVLSPSGDLLSRWAFQEPPYSGSIPYGTVSHISATRDGNLLLYGTSVCRMTLSGEVRWVRSFSNPPTEYNLFSSMAEDSEGKYILTGESQSTLSGTFKRSIPFMVIDSSSAISTFTQVATVANNEAFASHIYEQGPNDYILTGTLVTADNSHFILLTNVTKTGAFKWSKTFDYSNGFAVINYGGAVSRFSNGSYVATGISYRLSEGNPEYRKTVLLKWRKPD